MDSAAAMLMGYVHEYSPVRMFDWDAAANAILARNAVSASAGLCDDLEYNCDAILRDKRMGFKSESRACLHSTWAIPVLIVDGEEIPCWVWQKDRPEWDEDTYWPESAASILLNGWRHDVVT